MSLPFVPADLPSANDIRSSYLAAPVSESWLGAKSDIDFDSFRLNDARTPVSDQQRFPFCVTNALCDAMEYLLPGAVVQLSRMYVHFFSRLKAGKQGLFVGTSIGTSIQAVAEHGVPAEEDWPYDESKWDVWPDLATMQAADCNKEIEARSIGLDQRKAHLRACLDAGFPIVIATEIDDAFCRYAGGIFPPPSGKIIGAHAMVCVGYGPGYFILRNSWGTGWGENGYIRVSEDWVMDWFEVWVIRRSLKAVVRG